MNKLENIFYRVIEHKFSKRGEKLVKHDFITRKAAEEFRKKQNFNPEIVKVRYINQGAVKWGN